MQAHCPFYRIALRSNAGLTSHFLLFWQISSLFDCREPWSALDSLIGFKSALSRRVMWSSQPLCSAKSEAFLWSKGSSFHQRKRDLGWRKAP